MMINNRKGFGKFEVLTMIVLLLCIFAYLMYSILGGANKQKYTTMKDNAIRLGNVTATNISSFRNQDTVYLEEVIDEQLLKKNIKSPFSSKDCDLTESKVEIVEGKALVTLKCDQYLIEKYASSSEPDIYEVGEWSLKKNDDSEEKVLFNCIKDGKEIYPNYYEELYFVSKINKDYSTSYYFADNVKDVCEVVIKSFYRTKKKVEYK